MRGPDGGIHVMRGTYEELVPAKKIVFTWEPEKDANEGISRVTVDLAPEGKGTKLVLTHERLVNAKSRDSHLKGWAGCLDNLALELGR
jgi:uncharacterized protein YndB with AHSA1/START domain